jgi:hypothetical protein
MNKKHPADFRGEQTVVSNQWLVIGASSLGTVFEWYDFYLYGLLAGIITAQFFSGVNEITGFIFALAAFAATGDIYYGLWYPIVVAGATLVVGLLFLPETFSRKIDQ